MKDAESSIAEDVSISSELERAISSAAAAVEEFGLEEPDKAEDEQTVEKQNGDRWAHCKVTYRVV